MCGIAGYISDGTGNGLRRAIQQMTDAVLHRGPDGEGIYVAGKLALGHRRLSIIDLSDLASQPMRDEQSGCVIVFNGEIYNYVELKQELAAKGHKFATKSDTEVILKAYSQWGEDCVQHFNGMWSFAIHDPRRNMLFCSRDRFGEKPFYYVETGGAFAFGSELRQLAWLLPKRTANRDVLRSFLLDREAEPLDQTFFTGLRKLPAGHNLVLDIQTMRFGIRRYFELTLDEQAARMNSEDATERFAELMTWSVRLRLRSDVRVGTCLSGGLDSSSIAALASPEYRSGSGQPFAAITAVSEDSNQDESPYAELVVERSKLEWHRIRPTYDDFRSLLDATVNAQEEPFASTSIVMQHAVMHEARRLAIPVLLDGQGGDEALLGYHRYFAAYLLTLARGGSLAEAGRLIMSLHSNGEKGAIANLAYNLAAFHVPSLRNLALRQQSGLFSSELGVSQPPVGREGKPRTMFHLQKEEVESTNLPALLRYEDKNAMWHSVETRLPFLDHGLVQFAVSAAPDTKLRNGWSKHMLRECMKNVLPAKVAWRKSKLGFEAPELHWMKMHHQDVCSTLAASPMIAALAKNPMDVTNLASKVKSGLRWRLYSLALWEKQFGVTDLS